MFFQKAEGVPTDAADNSTILEAWESNLRRDLEKAYCAFSVEGPELAPPTSPLIPRRIVSCVDMLAEGDADITEALAMDAMVQWMAASEAGRSLRLVLPGARVQWSKFVCNYQSCMFFQKGKLQRR